MPNDTLIGPIPPVHFPQTLNRTSRVENAQNQESRPFPDRTSAYTFSENGLAGAPLGARPEASPASPEIRRVAEEFEAMFLAEMLAPMFENIETDGLGGGGLGERVFRPMLVERYAEAIAKAGGVGLAENVMRELTRLQTEAGSGAAR